MGEPPKYNEKMIAAKLKLLERFKAEKARRDESRAQGRLPPGQRWTEGFPVLDLGVQPAIDLGNWSLRVFGAVENPLTLSWEDLLALPKAERVADFHCVTSWSKKDARWGGVLAAELLARARPAPTARFLIQHCAEGYTTNTALPEAQQADAMIAYELDGAPLPLEHGGPARMVIPTLYAWKSGKFLRGLELCERDKPGYWETRGYHNNADPWKEERHGEPPPDDALE